MLEALMFWVLSIPTSLIMQYGALYKMIDIAARNGYVVDKSKDSRDMYIDLMKVIVENTPRFDLYTIAPLLNLVTSFNFSYLIVKYQNAICDDMEYLGYYRKMTEEEQEFYNNKPTTFTALKLAFEEFKDEYKEIPVEKSLTVINESEELKRIKDLKEKYMFLRQSIDNDFDEEYIKKLK